MYNKNVSTGPHHHLPHLTYPSYTPYNRSRLRLQITKERIIFWRRPSPNSGALAVPRQPKYSGAATDRHHAAQQTIGSGAVAGAGQLPVTPVIHSLLLPLWPWPTSVLLGLAHCWIPFRRNGIHLCIKYIFQNGAHGTDTFPLNIYHTSSTR